MKSNAQQKPFLTYLVEEREWKSQMDSEPDIMLEAVDHQGPRRPVLGSEHFAEVKSNAQQKPPDLPVLVPR